MQTGPRTMMTRLAHRWAGPAAIVAATLFMLWFTWLRWTEPFIDFGLQVYTPWRLSQGAVLYRDVASLYGPLSSYVHAGLFRVFGPSLHLLIGANLVLFAALLAMLYDIGRFIAGRAAATAGCLLVVLLCGFNQYELLANYNFMTPYSHEATHGLVLAVAAVFAMQRFARTGRVWYWLACGICVGLAALGKPESSLASAGAALAGLALLVWRGHPGRRAAALTLLFLGGVVLPIALSVALFARVEPWGEALRSTFTAWLLAANPALRNLPLYREWMGTNAPGQRIAELLETFAWYGAWVAVLAGLAVSLPRRLPRPYPLVLTLAAGAILLLPAQFATRGEIWFDFVRPLPLLLAILLAVFGGRGLRRGLSPAAAVRLIFVVLALLMLARTLLNTRLTHFGFVLDVPGLVVLAALLFSWIPRGLDARARGAGRAFAAAALLLMVIISGVFLHLSYTRQTIRTTPVSQGGDFFYAGRAGLYMNALVVGIDDHTSPDQTVAVLPENAMVNYLARRATPTRYVQYEPSEIAAFGEENILEAFERYPPDYVLLVHRDSSEYGVRFFGRNYATHLFEWILHHYGAIQAPLGAKPFNDENLFGVLVMRRLDAPPAPPSSTASQTRPSNPPRSRSTPATSDQ